jgi:hypothetical protein
MRDGTVSRIFRLSGCGSVRGLASAKLAFLFRSSTTCRTGDGECLLGARVAVMPKPILPQHPCIGMVNFEQFGIYFPE